MTGALQLSAASAAEWTHHLENILRGVGHALNNRAAALAAVMEITSGDAADARAARDLTGEESRQLAALARVLRTIDAGDGAPQAFVPGDAVADALALLELHRDFRDGLPDIAAQHAAPVRTSRPLFVRELVVLAAGARAAGGRIAPLILDTEGDWLVATARGTGPCTPLAVELATAMGGEPLDDGRYGIRIPTLEAIRRREGR